MSKPYFLSLAAAASLALPLTSVHAAATAADNAGNYSGNYPGANNGSGFAAFVATNNGNGSTGTFLGTSTNNGVGGSSGGINSGNGTAFGLYGNNGGSEVINRSFLAGSDGQITLSVGQSFSLDFDNGRIADNSNVGFNLLSANSTDRFTFQFLGGANDYVYNTGTANNVDTGVNFTSNGLHITFTQGDANAFTVSIAAYDANGVLGTPTTLNDTLSGSDISQFQIFNNNAAGADAVNGPQYDLFFNNLAVVPEPSTLAAVVAGTVGLGLVVRRRRRA